MKYKSVYILCGMLLIFSGFVAMVGDMIINSLGLGAVGLAQQTTILRNIGLIIAGIGFLQIAKLR